MNPGCDDVLAEVLAEAVAGGRIFGQDRLDLVDQTVLDDVTGSQFVEHVREDVGVLVFGAPCVRKNLFENLQKEIGSIPRKLAAKMSHYQGRAPDSKTVGNENAGN